jgi:hypothetical protein
LLFPGIQGGRIAHFPVDFRRADGGLAPPRIIAGMPQAELKTKARAKKAVLKQHNGTAPGDFARAVAAAAARLRDLERSGADEVARLRRANASAEAVEAALRALPSYKPPKRRLQALNEGGFRDGCGAAVRFGAGRARFELAWHEKTIQFTVLTERSPKCCGHFARGRCLASQPAPPACASPPAPPSSPPRTKPMRRTARRCAAK